MSETRYELLDRIAVGGTAEVYRAQAIVGGERRPVVLKRVLPQLAHDGRFRRLFAEEARFAAALEHPHIVRILDFGELDGTCFLALEQIDGHDLGRLLAIGAELGLRLPAPLAALIATRVARALAFAHEQVSAEGVPLQIIHRDVSPENILVSFQGDVKLTDFGIADSVLAARDEAEPQGLRGKAAYMAPEQAAGGPLDHRSDLFALGCVLHELLSGAPPFRGASEAETLTRLRAFLPRPNVAAIDAPAPLRRALDQLLQRRPSERLQHADALIAQLEPYLSSCGEAGTERALGAWARELDEQAEAKPEVSTPEAMVDDAVRALLGDPDLDLDLDPSQSGSLPVLDDAADTRQRTSTQQVPTSLPARPEPPSAPVEPPREQSASPAAVVAKRPSRASSTAELAERPSRDEPPRGEPPRGEGTGEVLHAPARWHALPWLITALAVLVAGSVLAWTLLRSPAEPDPLAGSATPADAGAPGADRGRKVGVSVSVRLESRPSGATVRLDGERRGSTPLTLRLPARPVVLSFSKTGYHPRRLRLKERPVDPVVVKLRRRRRAPSGKRGVGYLTLNSLPWSKVYLDGRYLGNTPLVSRHVRAGRRSLVLKDGRGRVRKRLRVRIVAGKRHRFSFDLR